MRMWTNLLFHRPRQKVCIVLKFGMNFPRLLAIKILPGFGLDLTPVQGVMTIAHWVIINDPV